ncbi:MAG: hypothetical protein Q9213_004722 [Squamulea squamosa]
MAPNLMTQSRRFRDSLNLELAETPTSLHFAGGDPPQHSRRAGPTMATSNMGSGVDCFAGACVRLEKRNTWSKYYITYDGVIFDSDLEPRDFTGYLAPSTVPNDAARFAEAAVRVYVTFVPDGTTEATWQSLPASGLRNVSLPACTGYEIQGRRRWELKIRTKPISKRPDLDVDSRIWLCPLDEDADLAIFKCDPNQHPDCRQPRHKLVLDDLDALSLEKSRTKPVCFVVAYAHEDRMLDKDSMKELAQRNPDVHAQILQMNRPPATEYQYMWANYRCTPLGRYAREREIRSVQNLDGPVRKSPEFSEIFEANHRAVAVGRFINPPAGSNESYLPKNQRAERQLVSVSCYHGCLGGMVAVFLEEGSMLVPKVIGLREYPYSVVLLYTDSELVVAGDHVAPGNQINVYTLDRIKWIKDKIREASSHIPFTHPHITRHALAPKAGLFVGL